MPPISTRPNSRGVVATAARLLTFRLAAGEFRDLGRAHLLFGLACAWVVGVGRWWDDPRAGLLQHLGVGSVIYVFVLAGLLWLTARPLRPRGWSYVHVLTFVALTSPPALLYAIPAEMLFGLEPARGFNVLSLCVVASWRVALLVFYLRRHGRLSPAAAGVATFLPVAAIVCALAWLNLERAAFETMGGLRGEPTANDSAYALLTILAVLSFMLLPVLLVVYAVVWGRARRRAERGGEG